MAAVTVVSWSKIIKIELHTGTLATISWFCIKIYRGLNDVESIFWISSAHCATHLILLLQLLLLLLLLSWWLRSWWYGYILYRFGCFLHWEYLIIRILRCIAAHDWGVRKNLTLFSTGLMRSCWYKLDWRVTAVWWMTWRIISFVRLSNSRLNNRIIWQLKMKIWCWWRIICIVLWVCICLRRRCDIGMLLLYSLIFLH